MSSPPAADHPLRDPETAAAALRERVYATLTGLSTVLVLLGVADSTSVLGAAVSVAVTMAGLWAASLVAEIVAHTAVHGEAPQEKQRRTIGATAAQALETAVVPVLLIGLSGTGIWTLRTGLVLASVGLVLTLVVVALLAVRRSTLSVAKRVLVVIGELALGLAVVAIKLLAH